MRHVEICNWSRYQHYKDRDPTWLKLHRSLLSDYQWSQLPDVSKGQLIGLWLVAARCGNRIPADPAWLAHQIGATDPVDIDSLVAGGWCRWIDDASTGGEGPVSIRTNPLASCYQVASDVLAEGSEGDPTGEQSPGSSDVLASCYQPASDVLALAHSREKRREEKRREEESQAIPSQAREAGQPPSFISFTEEQRAEVDALARLSAARRGETT